MLSCGLICFQTSGFAGEKEVNVIASLYDGNVSYKCVKYEPPLKIKPFDDGVSLVDSATNLVFSQYTHMMKGDWPAFTNLWPEFSAAYRELGTEMPAPSLYINAWEDIFSRSEPYIAYKVDLAQYTLMVVEFRDGEEEPILRMTSTMKRDRNRYVMTRDLSMAEYSIENALENLRFDPLSGTFSLVSVSGEVKYGGVKTGPIHISVVRAIEEAVWESDLYAVIDVPGAYSFSDVVEKYDYIVKAFMDVDGNGRYDEEHEPVGYYAQNPIFPNAGCFKRNHRTSGCSSR